ncbi:RDD family protein [Erythrobacter sp. HA6-11]
MEYGGFWIRVGAYLVDLVIMIIFMSIVGFVFGENIFDTTSAASVSYGATDLIGLVVGIAYFAGFESSSWQATPGKRALGLIVTDSSGGRISFLRALGRYFAKILSGLILFIGYIMVGFTERKQGLHDFLASTLVIKGQPGTAGVDPSVFS